MERKNEKLLSYGLDCRNKETELVMLTVPEIYQKITSDGESALITMTQNLRSILRYSKERYRAMKTNLPFFSCSVFLPARRGIQNFVKANGLIIDIDLENEAEDELIRRMKADDRIVMGYTSPSNMGLKLLFLFEEPINDAGLYTRVYKNFTHDFCQEYRLADTVDRKNSDVSRISFICHDKNAWVREDFQYVRPKNEWIMEHEEATLPYEETGTDGLTTEAYRQILKLLESRPKSIKTDYPRTEEITEILDQLRDELEGYGIVVKGEENLPYGIKLKVSKGNKSGEINIYHGKHGYSTVTSARRGTDRELNEVTRHIVDGFLMNH